MPFAVIIVHVDKQFLKVVHVDGGVTSQHFPGATLGTGHEAGKLGINTPPIKTEHGWLTIYHAVGADKYYRLGALLLDERVTYLKAETPLLGLPEGKHGMGFYPLRSPKGDPIFEHVLKAFDCVFEKRMGPNGLPLIGAGDWNDGLDEIGAEGRGESSAE